MTAKRTVFQALWATLPLLLPCQAMSAADTPQTGAETTPAKTPAADASARIEEVVVTARKREESLQNVPVSVLAITSTDLQKRSLENLASVGQVTPNLTFSQTGNGGNSAGLVYIRGVGQYDHLSTFDPAVGIYIDGVYFARMENNDLDMLGIERLEILRGPQGTLFGKNTNGGAINIVTKAPNAAADAFEGRAQVTGGNFNRRDVLADANIPLVADRVALRIAGSRRSQDGYAHFATGEEMNDKDRYSARLALWVKLSDRVSATLRSDYTHFDEANAAMKLLAVNPNGGLLSAFNSYQAATGGLIYDNRWASPSDFVYNGTGANFSKGSLWGTSLTLDWDNALGAFKSITAYRNQKLNSGIDADGSPVTELDYYEDIRPHQFSQEFQQSGNSFANRLQWVAGLYYFKEGAKDQESTDLADLNSAFSAIFGAPFSANFCQCLEIRNESYAVYGQGSYNLTDQWRFTLGTRYSIDDKSVERGRYTFSPTTGIGAATQPPAKKSDRFSAMSPRIGFDYRWNPNVMAYVSAAEGFKGGGFNGRSGSIDEFNEFTTEKVWTYELGLRSDWFDRRLRLNATAFYSDYTELQIATSFSKVVNGVPTPLTIVENVPKARITGGELELIAKPFPELKLIGSLGLTHARYTELNVTSSVTTHTRFPNTPSTTYNLGAEYSKSLTERYAINGRVDYTHKSAIETDLLNDHFLRQKPYGLLDARVTLDVASNWSVSLFGTNLTDEHYFTGGASNYTTALGWAFVDMAPPRQWGVSGEYRF